VTGGTDPTPTVEHRHGRVTSLEAIARLRLAAAQPTAAADAAAARMGNPVEDAEHLMRETAEAVDRERRD